MAGTYENSKSNELLYYIWLGIQLHAGSDAPKILLEQFGDITAIYHGSENDYAAFGFSKATIQRLCDMDLTLAKESLSYCTSEHIGFLRYDDPFYPGRLRAIDNPPPLLYYRGRLQMFDDYPLFGMVGTRSCSEQGFRTAYRMGYKTASAGGVVVNGLALGADAACIRGCLDAGGYAVGLLGCGIDRIYPSGNKELFMRLSRQGLILSEFPPFTRPFGANFPVRNRVISGLSVASVILEAGEGSGALHTAEHALQQGRKLFAVPGDVNDPLYAGPLSLIKNGAKMVTDAEDVLSEYSLMFPHRIRMTKGIRVPVEMENAAVLEAFDAEKLTDTPLSPQKRTLPKPKRVKARPQEAPRASAKTGGERHAFGTEVPAEKTAAIDMESASLVPDTSFLSPEEQTVYAFFEKHPILTIDEIASHGLKVDDVLSSLTILEVYGFLKPLPGGRYEKI